MIMEQWLSDLLASCDPAWSWVFTRRHCITARWPDSAVRAAEQDARNGLPADLDRYDAEVAAIKAAIPKPV